MRHVLSRYFPEVLELKPVATIYRQAAVYRVRTPQGTYALKQFRHRVSELRYVTGLLQHLEHLRLSPALLRTRDGQPFLRAAGGQLYYATQWLEGAERFSPADDDHVQGAGRSLAQMHRAGGSFAQRHPNRAYTGREIEVYLRRHRAFRSAWEHLKQTRPSSPFLELLGDALPRLKQTSTRALHGLQSDVMSRYLRRSDLAGIVCHRDITSPNLLADGRTKDVALIDFDAAGHSLPLIDLDKFLSNCLQWDFSRMKLALSAYHAVRPLSAADLYLLSHLMSLPKEEWHLLQLARKTPQQAQLLPRLQAVLQAADAKRQACQKLRALQPSEL